MTVHVISVGLSVLDSLAGRGRTLDERLAAAVRLEHPLELLSQAGIGGADRDKASAWLAGALTPSGRDGHQPANAARLAQVTRALKPALWPADFSAERDTFSRVPPKRRILSAEDIAILVCSDTPDGLLAGAWNATALTGGDLSRIRYIADPAWASAQIRGCAVMVRIRGMDASSEQGFFIAMKGLGLLGHHLHVSAEIPDREPVRFYLSGGFKAAIPYLIGLAEGLASLPETGPVEAFVLHETSKRDDSEPPPPPIPLPLRRLAPDLVERELRDLSEVPSGDRPPSNVLEGYAYHLVPGGWQLTSFGAGLQKLFGIEPGLGS